MGMDYPMEYGQPTDPHFQREKMVAPTGVNNSLYILSWGQGLEYQMAWSCVGNHRCCDFMSSRALSCPKDTASP